MTGMRGGLAMISKKALFTTFRRHGNEAGGIGDRGKPTRLAWFAKIWQTS
jgi:hypothetical protein